MAEGDDSIRNINLDQNGEKKAVEGKSIEQRSGFPELPVSELNGSSAPQGLVNGGTLPPLEPVHKHSTHSATDLKDILEKAPLLTPIASELDVSRRGDGPPRSDSSAKVSNINAGPPSPMTAAHATGEQSLPTGAGKASEPEEGGESGETSFVSSYLRAAVVNPSSLEVSSRSTLPDPSLSSLLPSQDVQKASTNDLSGPGHPPPPPPPPPPHPPTTTYPPTMMGPAGYGSILGRVVPLMMIPMSYDPLTNQPVMPAPMFASHPFTYPMAQNTWQMPSQQNTWQTPSQQNTWQTPSQQNTFNPPMLPNISCGYTGMNGTAGGMGATGGSPLTATFQGYGSHHSLDSRNIPVNGSAPSSEENTFNKLASGDYRNSDNTGGSRSYSINPGKDTRLTRLREPDLQWIRKKMDRHCRNNWEAVADARGWNYEEIRDHLSDCRHSRDSPFLKLLDTETFCTYTVQDFKEDMQRIGRKDILMEFDDVLLNNRA